MKDKKHRFINIIFTCLLILVFVWIIFLFSNRSFNEYSTFETHQPNENASIGIPNLKEIWSREEIKFDPYGGPHFRNTLFKYQYDPSLLIGEPIHLLGFISENENGDLLISRKVIECCEDHAQIIGIRVNDPDLILGEWYYIEGLLVQEKLEDGRSNDPNDYFYLDIENVQVMDEPKNANLDF